MLAQLEPFAVFEPFRVGGRGAGIAAPAGWEPFLVRKPDATGWEPLMVRKADGAGWENFQVRKSNG